MWDFTNAYPIICETATKILGLFRIFCQNLGHFRTTGRSENVILMP